MKKLIGTMLAACSLFITSNSLAQNSLSGNKDLRGLQRVLVVVTPENETQKFSPIISLELRKAGLKIAQNKGELGGGDGVIWVTIKTNAYPRNAYVEWNLLQQATLTRTKESQSVITWRHVDDRRDVNPSSEIDSMVRSSVDLFLNAWLGANGR